MSVTSSSLFCVFVLLTFSCTAWCLQCYHCMSLEDQSCGVPFEAAKVKVKNDCDVCYIQLGKTERGKTQKFIRRDCLHSDMSHSDNCADVDESCTCTRNLCNNVSTWNITEAMQLSFNSASRLGTATKITTAICCVQLIAWIMYM